MSKSNIHVAATVTTGGGPKGATHWGPAVDHLCALWLKKQGKDWFIWTHDRWYFAESGLQPRRIETLIELALPAAPWTGEGPPPAGTLCELRLKTGGWGKATIKYMSLDVCVWLWFRPEALTRQVELGADVHNMEFRPIRTPEQIAAEAKLEAAKDLYCSVNWNDGEEQWGRLSDSRKADYLKAIESGWQKVPRE